jgi:hypothetical protein
MQGTSQPQFSNWCSLLLLIACYLLLCTHAMFISIVGRLSRRGSVKHEMYVHET